VVIDDAPENAGDEVRIGSTVVVDVEGEEERYTIVGAIEAKPAQGLISNESPVGRALLGLRPGEEAVAVAPHGETRIRVVRIER
jgi:transcription elongation factor GreA